jgi:hypothetical protein
MRLGRKDLGKKSALLLAFALVLSSASFAGLVNAQTNVNGQITSDTVWKASGSPYVLTGQVVVDENSTLIIEQGVKIDLSIFSLQIKGTLNAKCNSSNLIEFASEDQGKIVFEFSSVAYNTTSQTGCIIENATINTAITIEESAPKIVGCQIHGGININKAAPTITGNNISQGNTAYAINVEHESSPTIALNTITGKNVSIALNLENNNATDNKYNVNIENNTIIDCVTGVGVGICEGTVRVYGNIISGSNAAVKVINSSAAVTVEYNLIMNNTLGVYVGSQVAVQKNTIYNNTVGVYYETAAQSLISYNNLMNNTQYNLQTTTVSPKLLEASYNYWGTQDIPTINQTIYDKNNNLTLGEVKYLPALDEPVGEAPVIPNVNMNPTPTATPTTKPSATQTTQPTQTATPTTSEVTQGTFGTLEIGILTAMIIGVLLTLIVAYKKGGKTPKA